MYTGHIIRKIRLYPVSSLVIAALLTGIYAVEFHLKRPDRSPYSDSQLAVAPDRILDVSLEGDDNMAKSEPELLPEIEQSFEQETSNSIRGIDPKLAALLENGSYSQLRERLLQLAEIAVSNDDMSRLAYILNLLGQISIQDQDLYSAKVYLTESLDIFEEMGDEIGSAQVFLQLGRTHLKSRQIARTAGTAYDELQVGRWFLEKGLYGQAETYIQRSIDMNMSINRFGSAASAYESLARLATENADFENVENYVINAAQLFASSGKVDRARRVLEMLPDGYGESDDLLSTLKNEIDTNHEMYRANILQIERARDYRRLYHYYHAQGDRKRAWKFRLLANSSLADVSKRALFHRQQGVLAILYNSNDSMDLAEKYFVRARETFDYNGMQELAEETAVLNNQIF